MWGGESLWPGGWCAGYHQSLSRCEEAFTREYDLSANGDGFISDGRAFGRR